MLKYEILGEEIIKYLKEQKKLGNKLFVIRATDISRMYEIKNRYPMICQAMEYATKKYPGIQIDGKNPSSSFTVQYKLTLF